MGEAMACGVPMVATDVGDAAAILDDPARIVPPGDAAGMAAIVVRLLLAGPEARAALGDRDRQRALARFTIAAVGDAYTALWDRLMRPEADASGRGGSHST
jgi:glycosyltransferase involved in cell wall biosynthesis